MSKKWRIGTSGWNYRHWKEIFYPPQLPVSKWLDFYADHFDTVELNATFYRLPKPETFDNWYKKTPDDFLWSVKASKYITHTRRLRDCREPLERLYESVGRLREKRGPILVQLPPTLSFSSQLLIQFCKNLDPFYRHTLEIRHPSWINTQVFDILKEYNIALCISDTAAKYPCHEVQTSDFLYVRLHGSRKLYASEYTEEELLEWSRKIRTWDTAIYLYFDNNFNWFTIKNAKRLKEVLSTN